MKQRNNETTKKRKEEKVFGHRTCARWLFLRPVRCGCILAVLRVG
ncbi:hypothetical protein HMPREF1985_00725 [Mitsuokella sp. oral taxon 131 str. W9106]|nr:hypothetical protein HMPREF1985_00725 [Mitsuokella sp. oral taxon 131 str. W9106]